MLKCKVDQVAFYWRKGDEIIIIVVHVNNLTIVASSVRLIEKVKHILKGEFKISDMREIHWILGFEVKRNRERRTVSLSQATYIRLMLVKYSFKSIKPYTAPMDPNQKLSTMDAPQTAQDFAYMCNKLYCEAVGSLQYASVRM